MTWSPAAGGERTKAYEQGPRVGEAKALHAALRELIREYRYVLAWMTASLS
jgi:hypothetical protein